MAAPRPPLPLPTMRKSAVRSALTLACYPTSVVMADPIRIDVRSERGTYAVLVGAGLASNLGTILHADNLDRELIIVRCPPVWRAQGLRLDAPASALPPTLIQDGERSKNLATVAKI